MKKIKYNQIERIFGDHLIVYNGRVYVTIEDIKKMPKEVTLRDKGLSEEEFEDIKQDTISSLMGERNGKCAE